MNFDDLLRNQIEQLDLQNPQNGPLIKQVLENKIHTNYWLVNEKCPTCGHGEPKIGVMGL